MKSKVSIVKCPTYDSALVFDSVKKAVDLIGGISNFIKPESKVLVKPNLLMAKCPESGIDTHPEVVRAVIRLLKEIRCHIYLGDGPSVWGNQAEDVDSVYEESGMKRISIEEGIELVKFNKRRWRGKFPLTTWLDECDYLVSVPKFKTHDLTILTGAIKNLYGLIPGTYKTELHKRYYKAEDFSRNLADIYMEVHPALTIVDGILALEGDGPATSGQPRQCGLLLAGVDCVALDSILALIMGLAPRDILSTKEAARRGLGIADVNSIEILGEKLQSVLGQPFKLPSTSLRKKIPAPIIAIAKNLITFYPRVNHKNCISCGVCINACPAKAISIHFNKVVIDYTRCISCFCCQEVCPSAAIKVKKSILARMIGL